jgi:putative transposase
MGVCQLFLWHFISCQPWVVSQFEIFMNISYNTFMIRSYVFRLQVSRRHRNAFEKAMTVSNEIYNAALEERIDAWRKQRTSISKFDQFKSLTLIRQDEERFSRYGATMLRTPLVQVDEAFKGFFSRIKKGGPAGFPRFRSLKRLRSFGFTEASGWTLKGKILKMKGLPNVRMKMHRGLLGKPVRLTIKKDARGRWFAIIVLEQQDVFGPTAQGAVGLDLGVENLVTDSNGVAYGKVSPDRENDRLVLEQALARKKRGSRRFKALKRQLAIQRHREASRRRTKHFQLASKIVRNSQQIIVIEDLKVKNMTRSAKGTLAEPGKNVKAKSGLNRSILDAGMAQFIKILKDKAESAGRLVIAVNPKGTSQNCSQCGKTVKKPLNQRQHICSCGANMHRDVNAARNILRRGVVAPYWTSLPLAA